MRRRALAVLLAVVVTGLAVPAGARAAVTWTGEWDTSFGRMTLTQSGASVDGRYTYDEGHIAGTVSGSVLSGTWDEAPTRAGPSDKGDIELTLGADLKSFSGRWRYEGQEAWSGGWSGTCAAGACLQNDDSPPPPAPPAGVTRSVPAPAPGAVRAVTPPALGRSTLAATFTLGVVTAGGATTAAPAVAAIELPVLPRRRDSARAALFCFIFMDINEDEFLRFINSNESAETYLQRVAGDERRRLRAFSFCHLLAYLALRMEAQQPAAALAGQAACAATAVSVVRTRRGLRIRRARSPRLRVGCTRTATGLEVRVRARKRGAKLRAVVGPRLPIAVGRARSDTGARGDRIALTTVQTGG